VQKLCAPSEDMAPFQENWRRYYRRYFRNIPLQVRFPDIVTPPLRWNPDNPDFDERFGITEIKLELKNKIYRAWVYTAEHSPHRFNNMIAEILTERIDGIAMDSKCAIHVDRLRCVHGSAT
jgi:hypothetical protein